MASIAYDALVRVVIRTYAPMTEAEVREYLAVADEFDIDVRVPGGKSVRITAGTVDLDTLTRAPEADDEDDPDPDD
jgi:hypothetical protein